MDIVQNIYILLDKQNRKQIELAKYLNVKPTTITEWRTKNVQPQAKHIPKLARYFNVSTDYLLGLTDDPTPPLQDLSIREKSLVVAYRGKPELQPVIDKILDVDTQ